MGGSKGLSPTHVYDQNFYGGGGGWDGGNSERCLKWGGRSESH